MFEVLLVWLVLTVQLDEAATIKNSQIANELSLPPVKLHCSSKRTLEGGGGGGRSYGLHQIYIYM